MKNIKILMFLLFIGLLSGCAEEDKPEITKKYNVTVSVNSITGTTAVIEISSISPDYYGNYKVIVCPFNNSSDIQNYDGYHESWVDNGIKITDLKSNTRYQYLIYLVDDYNDSISVSNGYFTTLDISTSIYNMGCTITSKKHTSYYYWYWTAYFSITNSSNVTECGIQINDQFFSKIPIYEGENSISMQSWSTSRTSSVTYRDYAKLNNGSYIYSDWITINMSY